MIVYQKQHLINMSKTEKIRNELERRIALFSSLSENTVNQNRLDEDKQLLSFLDTLDLEEEPALKGYDEAYLNEKIAKASKTWKGVDVDKYMDEVRDRELDMYDPQYLDMNYERYYFIPWPDSQLFEEEDPEKEFIMPVEGGVFLSMEWLNKNE